MIVSRGVLEEIREALERAYPEEGCGLLLGEAGAGVTVRAHVEVVNERAGERAAARRYLIAPEVFRDAERQARAEGLAVVGVYHSHPDVPPEPSEYDREHAWPWYHYLIVSVAGGTADGVRVWRLRDDRRGFVERELRVAD